MWDSDLAIKFSSHFLSPVEGNLKIMSTTKTIIPQNELFEAELFYFVEKLCSVLKIFKFLYF